MTYADLCAELRKQIPADDICGSAYVARRIVAHCADLSPEALIRDGFLPVSENVADCARACLRAYLSGKPLAYILGYQSFFGLDFKVTEDVLIPRDDTMAVTTLAMDAASQYKEPRILDLCTGSGCIGITIATKTPAAKVVLADLSESALHVAEENIARNGLASCVSTVKADALSPADERLGTFHVIVSNPPYITDAEMKKLPHSVSHYEPHMALLGGEDGLDFYRAICENYSVALVPNGWLCFEFGLGQETAVGEILEKNKFGNLRFLADNSNIIRAVAAQKKERNMGYGEENHKR